MLPSGKSNPHRHEVSSIGSIRLPHMKSMIIATLMAIRMIMAVMTMENILTLAIRSLIAKAIRMIISQVKNTIISLMLPA